MQEINNQTEFSIEQQDAILLQDSIDSIYDKNMKLPVIRNSPGASSQNLIKINQEIRNGDVKKIEADQYLNKLMYPDSQVLALKEAMNKRKIQQKNQIDKLNKNTQIKVDKYLNDSFIR